VFLRESVAHKDKEAVPKQNRYTDFEFSVRFWTGFWIMMKI